MANPRPSKTFADMPREQRVACGRKGGSRTKAEYKTSKSLASVFEVLLNLSLDKRKVYDVAEVRSFGELKGKNISVKEAIGVVTTQKALRGDMKAIEFIRDTVGEKPTDKLDITDLTPTVLTGEGDIRE